MNWQRKVSNWLSAGNLDQSQKLAEVAEAKLKQQSSLLERLSRDLEQSQIEIERLKAQLQISQGFQIELGETKVELKTATAEIERLQQQYVAKQQELETIALKQVKTETQLSESQDWLKQIKTPIKISAINKLLSKQEFDALWGFGLSTPQVNTEIKGGAISIKGWILGRKSPIEKVQITVNEKVAIEALIGQSSPTIINRYPDIPGAGKSGFECSLSLVAIPPKVDLVLQAVLQESGKIISLCSISVVRD